MKPSVIIGGKRPIYNPDKNRLTIHCFFQKLSGGEYGEIDLINGDVPQIIVTAPASVQVEKVLKKEEPKKTGR